MHSPQLTSTHSPHSSHSPHPPLQLTFPSSLAPLSHLSQTHLSTSSPHSPRPRSNDGGFDAAVNHLTSPTSSRTPHLTYLTSPTSPNPSHLTHLTSSPLSLTSPHDSLHT
eukprot:GHVN01062523.1.p1 GENE.GHVN01062523.1~~GHVN01062523.1.p1  ORF type:complete len:110 (-),score=85.66 GHVN01062523.1:11-340(-)